MNKDNQKPDLVIIAGPNGAGKSTVAEFLISEKNIQKFINADTIARGMDGLATTGGEIAAGRVMLEELKGSLKKGIKERNLCCL